jgi:CheY-like chemotaxis protein
MSHEIRTPLGVVTGFCELAHRERGKPEAQEYLVGIKRAGESLLGIVNDILDFSKIEFGHLTIDDSPYHTASLLNDVLAAIRFKATEKLLTLTTDIAPDIPCTMIGDAGRIRQILLNLLSNAVKYSTEGGSIQLTIFGERTAENAIHLTLSVEDSGIGIKQEELPKVFDDFTRLDEKRNSAIEGTGLGLPIARSLCRAMGGDLLVVSEYGKGSLFTATLMQSVNEWEPMSDLASPKYYPEAPVVTFSAPKAEVLLVDDFPDNLRVAEGLLRPYRMRVQLCRNGLEALDLVQSHNFDLVLMDHMMPVMDGMEATTHIRALGGRFATLPIVALTANAVGEIREFFLEHGFSDYISKPIAPAMLDAILTRWIPEEKQAPAELPEYFPEATQAPGAKQEFGMAGAAKTTLAAQRLNLLNHYRWHFVNDMPVDTASFEKFCALVEVMDVPPQMQGDMASLAAAGRRGDVAEIQRHLPDVYEAIAHAMQEGGKNGAGAQDEMKKLKDALTRLKEALDRGDSQSTEAAMCELEAMDSLSDGANELYFFLNDALLMRQREKAAGGLAVWVKSFDKLA